MTKLTISQFSCIQQAELELGRLTVLIGPQASGKSVISKLVYFFENILTSSFFADEEERKWKDFNAEIVEDFKKWFPVQAWGKGRFVIRFESGPVEISIARTLSSNRPGKNVKINFSKYFESAFAEYNEHLGDLKKGKNIESMNFERSWRMQRVWKKKFDNEFEGNYVQSQTFIPAGRAFFTNVGRAIAVFDHGGMLDPSTLAFGRLFHAVRENWGRGFLMSNRASSKKLAQAFFGGELKSIRGNEYVEMPDGRKISFPLLSSGQQELLPLWMVIESVAERTVSQLIYIEEPEAHLFPEAQSQLIQYLAGLSSRRSNTKLMITTHSPYVLTKLNNLLKAGYLASKSKETAELVTKVIPRDAWLQPSNVRAYALIAKNLKPIIGDNGLIDAEYLDEISGAIAEEFSELQEIEYGETSG